MRRITSIVLVCSVAIVAMATAVAAGDMHKGQTAKLSAEQMAAMKDAMMKCAICKAWVPHLQAVGPIATEVVKLDNGIAMSHTVAPANVAALHKACTDVKQAAAQAMSFTDEQAKAQLCELCQGIRSSVKAGAMLSTGDTQNGDLLVLASTNPAVQTQLAALGEKCAMMMATQQASR